MAQQPLTHPYSVWFSCWWHKPRCVLHTRWQWHDHAYYLFRWPLSQQHQPGTCYLPSTTPQADFLTHRFGLSTTVTWNQDHSRLGRRHYIPHLTYWHNPQPTLPPIVTTKLYNNTSLWYIRSCRLEGECCILASPTQPSKNKLPLLGVLEE